MKKNFYKKMKKILSRICKGSRELEKLMLNTGFSSVMKVEK